MATNVYLKSKVEERNAQAEVLSNLQATASKEQRDLSEHERQTFDSIVSRLAFLDAEIKRITDAEAGSARFMEVYGAHKSAEERAAAAAEKAAEQVAKRNAENRQVEERASWGRRFTESEAFKRYEGRGVSQSFTIAGHHWVEERAAISTSDLEDEAGVVRPSQWWTGPTEPRFRTPLFDVIGRVPTSMASVEYLYIHPAGDTPDDMAAVVPEGQAKPEAPFEAELKAKPMKTYAWWKGITRQALDDIPAIQATVDGFLRRGVQRKIEQDAAAELLGDGDIPAIGGDLLGAIRRGLAMVDDAGYSANAVALNPMDWADLDIDVMGIVQTIAVGRSFWGIVPVPVSGLPSGTAYVGDFREGVTWFDRDTVNVLMSDSHDDYFVRNMLVILAEARGLVAVTNAQAMVKVTVGGDGENEGNAEPEPETLRGRSQSATPPPASA